MFSSTLVRFDSLSQPLATKDLTKLLPTKPFLHINMAPSGLPTPPLGSERWDMRTWMLWYRVVGGKIAPIDMETPRMIQGQMNPGWWTGVRNPYNPDQYYRLPDWARDYDSMRQLAGGGGQFFSRLGGYSGYGQPGQSLFAHHLASQMRGIHGGPLADQRRSSTGFQNQWAAFNLGQNGVNVRDFAYP
jgi:hypothetical protein